MATPEQRLAELRQQYVRLQQSLRERQGQMAALQREKDLREQYIYQLRVQKADLERQIQELGG